MTNMTAKIVGWGLLAIGTFFLLRTARLDRRLQKFRAQEAPRAAYLGQLGRWRRELYSAEGQPLIRPTRWSYALFCIAWLIGVLLLNNAPE